MHAVVVSFDHLHLGYIGCYGNDWIETPNLDTLAVESVVFDQHFGEDFDRDAAYRAWWTGRYESGALPDQPVDRGWLTALLRSARVTTRLLIEADVEDSSVVAPDFDHVETVRTADDLDVPEAEAGFARLVTEAGHTLAALAADPGAPSSLLWLKSRGVPTPWLPPKEFADLYLAEFGLAEDAGGEDDPEDTPDMEDDDEEEGDSPEELVSEPLATVIQAEEDESTPRDIELYSRALYAGYVTYLDRWLGKLLVLLDQFSRREKTLLIVVAGAGESLGEHGELGDEACSLHEELVHAPLIVRVCGSDEAGSRCSALVQPVDIPPTLLEWFGIPLPSEAQDGRSLLRLINHELGTIRHAAYMGHSSRTAAIRTNDFFYVRDETSEGRHPGDNAELFEKPADRWEMADVSGQYPQIVEELDAHLSLHRSGRAPAI